MHHLLIELHKSVINFQMLHYYSHLLFGYVDAHLGVVNF